MPMLPPLVREPPAGEPGTTDTPRAPFTGHPVGARLARTQRRYASNYNVSYMYEPPKPMARPEPPPLPPPPPAPAPEPTPAPAYESTFDQWRAVADAERERLGVDAADPHDAAMPAPAPRRGLHDALLGTTAVVLLSVLGGIVYYAWDAIVPNEPAADAKVGRLVARCTELRSYIKNNEGALIDYGERYRAGKPISTSRAEGTVNQLVNARMNKRRQMRWSPRGAHRVLQVRAAVLDGRFGHPAIQLAA